MRVLRGAHVPVRCTSSSVTDRMPVHQRSRARCHNGLQRSTTWATSDNVPTSRSVVSACAATTHHPRVKRTSKSAKKRRVRGLTWVSSLVAEGSVPSTRSQREAAIPSVPPPKRHPYNQWAPDARALDLVGDKWTLLIVRDLVAGPRRFVELQRVLPGISTEQLRSRLNRMVADGLLTRQRYREVPPRVDYELTERARDLLPVVGALARWGSRWAWSPPEPDEAVDIGAILRMRARALAPPTRSTAWSRSPSSAAPATSSATCSPPVAARWRSRSARLPRPMPESPAPSGRGSRPWAPTPPARSWRSPATGDRRLLLDALAPGAVATLGPRTTARDPAAVRV